MKNIEEQQIIIECPNTIFHLYIDSEDELSKVKVFMNLSLIHISEPTRP